MVYDFIDDTHRTVVWKMVSIWFEIGEYWPLVKECSRIAAEMKKKKNYEKNTKIHNRIPFANLI